MSSNVFADMELPNPEERLLKSQMVLVIRSLVDDSKLTQVQIAERVGMSQPAVSRMLKGMTKDISVEKLMNVVTSLGHNVRIVIGSEVVTFPSTFVEFDITEQRSIAVA